MGRVRSFGVIMLHSARALESLGGPYELSCSFVEDAGVDAW
jgi:hypothetical protein